MSSTIWLTCPARWLTALPVFNEAHHVDGVLDEVRQHCPEILVVDDGSTDETAGGWPPARTLSW